LRPVVTGRIVDVVIPVERDADAALRCLRSLFASAGTTPYHALVVTSDAEAARAIATGVASSSAARLTTICDERLPDHAARIHRGFAAHDDRDVVVLQAGTEVAADWLDRLAAHAGRPGIGIVGAFGTAGSTATYRRADLGQPVAAPPDAAALDHQFARVNRGRSVVVAVIHGPCLYVTRECISAVGTPVIVATDHRAWATEFSRRARAAGLAAAVAGDTLVASNGGDLPDDRPVAVQPAADVGSTAPDASRESTPSPEAAIAELAGRADVALQAASPRPAIVFIAHAWGGGIRKHMTDLESLVQDRVDVLYIEPADATTVKLHRRGGFATWFRLPDDLPLLAQTLRVLGAARLHFHHVHGLPQSILQLPAQSGLPYDCTLHDYWPICPQYHLAGENGRYCGEAGPDGCRRCVDAHPAQWNLDIDGWRAVMAKLLRGADRVIAPSKDVAARITRYVPGLAIDVWPHPESPVPVAQPVVRVVTLGVLSPEKGLDVVAGCAADARRRGLPLSFRVLGSTTAPLARYPDVPLSVHGSYDDGQLPQLLAAEHADVLFFPAQIPETYSYTLSIAIAWRTPIVASALGAFTERLAGHPRTRLLPWDAAPSEWNDALIDAACAVRAPAPAHAADTRRVAQ
jgi:glycosyltransferase involved in cell wall biosynthesis